MPLKKIDNKENRRKSLYIKIVFITLALLLSYYASSLIGAEPQESAIKPPNTQEILGEAVDKGQKLFEQEAKRDMDIIKRELDAVKKMLEKQGISLYEKHSEEAEDKASEIINKQAIDPIITQIQKLPDKQRNYLQEKMCQ